MSESEAEPYGEVRTEKVGWASLDPEVLADLESNEWPTLRPRVLQELERRGMDLSEVPDEALPGETRCPRCHWPVFQVTVVGPGREVNGPCGCRVAGRALEGRGRSVK